MDANPTTHEAEAMPVTPLTQQIKMLVLASEMSQHEIAMKAGVSPPQLYRFMSGERGLSLEVLDKIAAVVQMELKGYEEAAKKVKRA